MTLSPAISLIYMKTWDIYWFAVTVTNVFWTMDIQKRILKYSTVSIKKDAE